MRLNFKTPEPKRIRYRIQKPQTSRSPIDSSLTRTYIISTATRSPLTGRNKTQSDSQPSKNFILTKLKTRKVQSKPHVNPEFARNVLKIYFLPYFEEKLKKDHDTQRYLNYGNRSKTPERKIYARLSDLLRQSLIKTQKELKDLRSTLDAVNKEKDSYQQEILALRMEMVQSSVNRDHQDFHQSTYKSWVFNNELSLTSINQQVVAYKKKSSKKIERYYRLLSSVYTETDKNNNLKNRSKQLRFWHCLHQMVNQLSGESLKGTYYTLSELINSENLETKLANLFTNLHKLSYTQESSQELNIFSITTAGLQQSRLISKASKDITLRSSILKDLKSLKLLIIDRIDRLGMSLKQTCEENERLSLEIDSKEKAISDFTEEYESMLEKIREAQALMRQDRLELLCRLCNSNYYEATNFNWSCCTHSSEWSGETYWCCGSTVKEAQGCNRTKHQARDEEAEEEEKEKARVREMVQGVEKKKYCTSCKKEGHLAQDCSADPNLLRNLRELTPRVKKVKVRELVRSRHVKFGKEGNNKKQGKEGFRDIEDIRAAASQSVSPSSTWRSGISYRDLAMYGENSVRSSATALRARNDID